MRDKPNFVLNILGFGTAVALLGDATLYTVLPHQDIYSQLGISLSMVGILLGANRAIRLVLNGPIGVLYDRLPRRGLLVGALAIGTASSILYAAGSGFWPLLLGRLFWGLAWSLLWVGGNTVILDLSTEENRGKNSGLYQMWFFIGVASSSFLGGLLTDTFGFRIGQYICAATIAVVGLVWFLFLPETKRGTDPKANNNTADGKKLRTRDLWKIIAAPSLILMVSRFLTWGVLASTAIIWLSQIFGDGLTLASLFLPIATLTGLYTAVRNIISIGSTTFAGSLSDRLGRRWPVLGLAMLLGSIGLWIMSGDNSVLALAGAIFLPIAGSTTETLIPALSGDLVPVEIRSRALGLINTAGDFGATMGSVVALGILNSGLITLDGIYKIAAIIFLLIAIIAFAISSKKKATQNSKRLHPSEM